MNPSKEVVWVQCSCLSLCTGDYFVHLLGFCVLQWEQQLSSLLKPFSLQTLPPPKCSIGIYFWSYCLVSSCPRKKIIQEYSTAVQCPLMVLESWPSCGCSTMCPFSGCDLKLMVLLFLCTLVVRLWYCGFKCREIVYLSDSTIFLKSGVFQRPERD